MRSPLPASGTPLLTPIATPPNRRRLRLGFALFAFLFCSLLPAFYFCRTPLLTALARAWIVDDPPTRADAIVVLGGGLEDRPFAAARLYTNGFAPKILIAQPELPPSARMGLTVPEFVIARKILLALGVPDNAIEMIGTNVTSTRDEAFAVREWVEHHHARSVLIPTDLFHTRRARWIFRTALSARGADWQSAVSRIGNPQVAGAPRSDRASQVSGFRSQVSLAREVHSVPLLHRAAFSPQPSALVERSPLAASASQPSAISNLPSLGPCRVQIIAINPRQYTAADWWRSEEGLVAFQNEVIKYALYRWKY